MKIGMMLKDILKAIVTKPATERYPFERYPAPTRLRATLHWDPEKCTGCQLCSKECPADAIELITIDKKAKQFVMRYHADRCIYCGQCVENCRFDCLDMASDEWELASTTKEPFTVYYGDEIEIEDVLAGRLNGDAEPAG